MHGVFKKDKHQLSEEEREAETAAAMMAFADLREMIKTRDGSLDKNLSLLRLNPEMSTLWNIRREIILREQADLHALLVHDLLVLNEVMLEMQFTKAYCLWTHRRWLLSQLGSLPGEKGDILAGERKIVEKILNIDGRNFHAWCFREFLRDTFRAYTDPEEDLKFSTTLIEKDFSNYSAYFLRIKAIERGAIIDPIAELEMIWNAIFTEPNDQSVWQYHDWLMTRFASAEMTNAFLDYSNELSQVIQEKDKKYLLVAGMRFDQQLSQADRSAITTSLAQIDPFRKQYYLGLM